MRRLGAAGHLLLIAARRHPAMSAVMVLLAVVDAVRPAAMALATGALLRAAAHGHAVTGPLVVLGVVLIVPVGEARWRLAEQLGMRVGDHLDQQLMHATLAPAGLAHLDDSALRDNVERASTFWNSSLLEGLQSVAVVRVSGFLSVLVLAQRAGWLIGGLVGGAWVAAGWWSWRVATRGLDAQFDKAPELREVDYLTELALAPSSGKDVRVYGLGPWFVDRQVRLWRTVMEPLWATRRRHIPGSIAIVVVVAAVNVLAVVVVTQAGLGAPAVATALAALLTTSGLGEVPFGHYEMEFGLRTVPANVAVSSAVREARYQLPGTRPADGLPRSSIVLRGVRFAYPGQSALVLDGVDLELPAGSSTAIVGVNGAGKSTLVKLLARYYDPMEGRITVDGIDLRSIDPHAWHRRVSGLFQEFVRYPLSARDNISLRASRLDLATDDVWATASLAGIDSDLRALPEGLDTLVTRGFGGGRELSGGQWQRLALARAIFAVQRGVGLLMLDEPTAHLDARAEAELYDRFLEVTGGVTTVLVSHRFSTVRRADYIAVLAHGRVVEYGTHDSLVAHGGEYARLFALQASMFRESTDGD